MKSAEEIMEILEAYDLTGSFRDAAELAGCSPHTVARYVAEREAGGLSDHPAARPRLAAATRRPGRDRERHGTKSAGAARGLRAAHTDRETTEGGRRQHLPLRGLSSARPTRCRG
jgi:hypothetical protein